MTDMIQADFGIRQLHARFIDAVWRQDAEEFAACWTSDGLWKIAGMEVRGRAALFDACKLMLGRCRHIHLQMGPAILEADGDEVLGRLNVTEYTMMQDDSSALTFGWYHDRYAVEQGRWRFKARHWAFKYRGPLDLSGAYIDTPNYGAFPGFPAPDEPTFVRTA